MVVLVEGLPSDKANGGAGEGADGGAGRGVAIEEANDGAGGGAHSGTCGVAVGEADGVTDHSLSSKWSK